MLPMLDARDFRSIGAGGAEASGDCAGRAEPHEPGRGGQRGRRAAADGQHLAEALPGTGRGRPPGRTSGVGRKGKGALTAEEARRIRGWIADQTPDQLRLLFALWTSRAVREVIERRFGKRLGQSTVQLYLKRWGMTPQKPLVRPRNARPLLWPLG